MICHNLWCNQKALWLATEADIYLDIYLSFINGNMCYSRNKNHAMKECFRNM